MYTKLFSETKRNRNEQTLPPEPSFEKKPQSRHVIAARASGDRLIDLPGSSNVRLTLAKN